MAPDFLLPACPQGRLALAHDLPAYLPGLISPGCRLRGSLLLLVTHCRPCNDSAASNLLGGRLQMILMSRPAQRLAHEVPAGAWGPGGYANWMERRASFRCPCPVVARSASLHDWDQEAHVRAAERELLVDHGRDVAVPGAGWRDEHRPENKVARWLLRSAWLQLVMQSRSARRFLTTALSRPLPKKQEKSTAAAEGACNNHVARGPLGGEGGAKDFKCAP